MEDQEQQVRVPWSLTLCQNLDLCFLGFSKLEPLQSSIKTLKFSFSLADFQNGEAATYLSAENKILQTTNTVQGNLISCIWKIVKIVLQHSTIHRALFKLIFIKIFKEISIVSLHYLNNKRSSP